MDVVRGQTGSLFLKEQMLPDNMSDLGDKQTIDKTKQCASREAGETFCDFLPIAAPDHKFS